MPVMKTGPIFVAALWLACTAAVAENAGNATLRVTEAGDSYRLSVPVSHLVMTIPRGSFREREDATGINESPRYFFFEDETRHAIISGWFEHVSSYSGLEDLWKQETDAWRKTGAPQPENASFAKIDGWNAVFYDVNVPGGSNTHIRAQWVALDTWIDVHISVTTTEPIDAARATALDVLKSIQVAEAP
jgi:hypothetical protein